VIYRLSIIETDFILGYSNINFLQNFCRCQACNPTVWYFSGSHGCITWPWQMGFFGRFLTLFALKRPAWREKNTSNMADVRRWRHRVTSLQVLYWHVKLVTGLFPVLVFASHFQIILADTQPECYPTHLVVPYRYISLVYSTQYPFCPSALHVWRCDVASCTTHTFTGVASLCWTWRQWRNVRWALRVNLDHFLDVYNPKIVYTVTFTCIYL
jgi:hypothetical protein